MDDREISHQWTRTGGAEYRFEDGVTVEADTLRVLMIEGEDEIGGRWPEIKQILKIEREGAECPFSLEYLKHLLHGETILRAPQPGKSLARYWRYLRQVAMEPQRGVRYQLFKDVTRTRQAIAHILLQEHGPEWSILRQTVRPEFPHRQAMHDIIIDAVQRRIQTLCAEGMPLFLSVQVPSEGREASFYSRHGFTPRGRHPELEKEKGTMVWLPSN